MNFLYLVSFQSMFSLSFLANHFYNAFVLQEKTFSLDKLAKMPSCNLTETIHNKWLEAFGNKGKGLYVVEVDNYIHAFL